MSESPVDFSVEFTSSPVVAMVSARRLEVSTRSSVICAERSSIIWTMASDFCAKPCVTSSRRPSIICARLVVISANSSVMWSVLKFRLAVRRSLAPAMACGGFLAGALQALQQVAAALAERADHGVAGAAERERDVLALLGQRLGDLLGAVVDLCGDVVADRGNVVRQIEMHAGDGVAHLLGLADQGVALMRERLEQAADADFVVVVGALERGDFVGDQRFELGGARQRALDAVAHRRDLAADGLADGDDGLAGDLFRLGEPHGDARHRLGDQAHLLRAPHHVGQHVEEHDRRQHEAGEADHGRDAGRALLQHRLQVGQIDERERPRRRPPRRARTRSPPHRRSWTGAAAASAGSGRSTGGRRWRRTGSARDCSSCGRAPDVVEQVALRARAAVIGATERAARRIGALRRRRFRLRPVWLGGAVPSGSSETLRTCWMAVRVSSVGSVIFFGLFAMSAVASLVTGYSDQDLQPE